MFDKFLYIMPGIVTLLYFITALIYLWKQDYPWAMVWGSYGLANVGLIWMAIANAHIN